jgi:hypothetical protein
MKKIFHDIYEAIKHVQELRAKAISAGAHWY